MKIRCLTTRGVANVGLHLDFGAASPARAFSSGDENIARSPTLATPPAVGKCEK